MAYEVIKINENTWRIEDTMVRCFLFVGTARALLVDSGFGSGDLAATVAELTKLPVMLVNTHADGDHLGGNAQFEIAHMHPAEFARYAATEKSGPVAPLWDGDVIDLGERSFIVLLIPGHTPGSIALLDTESGVLVSGDTLSKAAIFMFGDGRNMDAYIESLTVLETLRCNDASAFDTVYPSHGEFPLSADVIPLLLDGARRLKAGELVGGEPPFPIPAQFYDIGNGMGFLHE